MQCRDLFDSLKASLTDTGFPVIQIVKNSSRIDVAVLWAPIGKHARPIYMEKIFQDFLNAQIQQLSVE